MDERDDIPDTGVEEQLAELEALYRSRSLVPPIKKLIRSYRVDADCAEELTQEVLTRMIETVRRGETVGNYWHLGASIARNLIRTQVRRSSKSKPLAEDLRVYSLTPDDVLEESEEHHNVQLALTCLSLEERLAIHNSAYGVTLREIAEEMGISIATVHRLQRDGIEQLKTIIEHPYALEWEIAGLFRGFCNFGGGDEQMRQRAGVEFEDYTFWAAGNDTVVIELWGPGEAEFQYLAATAVLRPFHWPSSEAAWRFRRATEAELNHPFSRRNRILRSKGEGGTLDTGQNK
jgi:RNA polymerase sigma factor (sigma-70 family)